MDALLIIMLPVFVLYIILMFFYLRWWNNVPSLSTKSTIIILDFDHESGKMIEKKPPPHTPETPVTVIIPARNEEKNIIACLQSLAEQTFPAELIQIIVVNDHSTDNTAQIVEEFPATNIKLINLADYVSHPINSYKKKAIEVAIEQATGDLIVTTDADCIAPPKWIENMEFAYHLNKPAFIVAPVRLMPSSKKERRSLLFVFQTLDFLALQGITAASVYEGFHSMCNGANLAYTKKAFYAVNGFSGIDKIASGDDMLLMYKISQKYPHDIMYLKNPDVIVDTKAATTWKEFIQQRIRWSSKADQYADRRISLVLLLVYTFNALLFLLFIGCIFYPEYLSVALSVLSAKIMLEMGFTSFVARFFERDSLLFWFPFLQPLHIIYVVVAGFFGKFGKYSWKGRKVQ